jgi:hypothetical protein
MAAMEIGMDVSTEMNCIDCVDFALFFYFD